jgi:hypothetical protein
MFTLQLTGDLKLKFMKFCDSEINQMELEKVMTKYGLHAVVHYIRQRRTTIKPLWETNKAALYASHQQKLEQIVHGTHQEIHKLPFALILRLVFRKIFSTIGKWLYLFRKSIFHS